MDSLCILHIKIYHILVTVLWRIAHLRFCKTDDIVRALKNVKRCDVQVTKSNKLFSFILTFGGFFSYTYQEIATCISYIIYGLHML